MRRKAQPHAPSVLRLFSASLLLCGSVVHAQDANVRIEQKLDAQAPMELSFRNEEGKNVRIGDLLHGKPALLALVYYRCPMACTLVLNGLALSMKSLSLKPGEDFTAIAVSFDPSDTPAMAAQRKAEALARCGRPGTESGWRFLTGTEPAARDLCRSVGFHYSFDPATGLYSHPTGIVVLTPEGRVSKYFLGVEYPARDVRLALVEASNGKIGSVTDGLLLLCSRYDPATGHYGLAVIRLVRYAGMLTLVALAAFVFRARFREARRASAGGL